MRVGELNRKTKETDVKVSLNLDGNGTASVNTGIKFLDHMLTSLATHACFDLKVEAKGDLEHHVTEDVMISLGAALERALGDKVGIERMGSAIVPMDDALALVAVDLSGRAYAAVKVGFKKRYLYDLSSELIEHMLQTLAASGKLNLHAQVLRGRNDHHKAEAIFKALGLALARAVERNPRRLGVPSAKGVL